MITAFRAPRLALNLVAFWLGVHAQVSVCGASQPVAVAAAVVFKFAAALYFMQRASLHAVRIAVGETVILLASPLHPY